MIIQPRKTVGLMLLALVLGVVVFVKTRTQSIQIAGFKKTDIEEVLKITGVTYDGTLSGLVQATQKAWLRPAGKERWEVQPICEDKKDQLLPIFTKLGLVDACNPEQKKYEHILFMGATIFRMTLRMEDLQRVIKEGIGYNDIVFLSGCRFLTQNEKEFVVKRGWKDTISTEADVYPQLFTDFGIPLDKVVYINAPETTRADGTKYRPTTADTVELWLKEKPCVGRVLVVSSQPFCVYQKVVCQTLLPKEFTVEVMGSAAPADTSIAVYLDTLARTLYQWAQTHTPLS